MKLFINIAYTKPLKRCCSRISNKDTHRPTKNARKHLNCHDVSPRTSFSSSSDYKPSNWLVCLRHHEHIFFTYFYHLFFSYFLRSVICFTILSLPFTTSYIASNNFIVLSKLWWHYNNMWFIILSNLILIIWYICHLVVYINARTFWYILRNIWFWGSRNSLTYLTGLCNFIAFVLKILVG